MKLYYSTKTSWYFSEDPNLFPPADRECYKDAPYDPAHSPVTALCGNYILEPGEECDCGPTFEDCNDACCYAAHIGPADRLLNATAVPCGRHAAYRCTHPVGLVYGVYVPLVVLLLAVVGLGVCLSRDWKGEKRWFRHITRGNVKIVG